METLPYDFIHRLKALPYVEAVYLFGSRARGDARERSDIDLAVKLLEKNQQHWQQVLAIIEEADTLLQVDCVNLDEADEELADDIRREAVRL